MARSRARSFSSCFYRWRRFLTGTGGAASPWAGQKKRRARTPDGFARVKVLADLARPFTDEPPGGEPIRLRLTGGRELVLPASTATGRLVELLVALEARA